MLQSDYLVAAGVGAGRFACDACKERHPAIMMMGYAENYAGIQLCEVCALQLARKLLEDLCALTPLGRHG